MFQMIGRTSATQSAPSFLLDPPTVGDFIALIANPASAGLADVFASAAAPHLPTFPLVMPTEAMEVVLRSDHVPYWASGHRSLLVTDTAEYRNQDYHSPTDTLDRLELDFAARVTTAAVRTITRLAG